MCTPGHSMQCKLFDTLVLPILSYVCEVWAVNPKVKQQKYCIEALSNNCRVSECDIVLAEFGRFPLQVPFWQQLLRDHHRTVALDNVKLALVSGYTLGADQAVTAAIKGWHCHVESFLACHSQQLLHKIGISSVVDREKHWIVFKYFQDDSHGSLVLFRTLQLEYVYAHYLSEVRCFSNRRLLSRFGSGCHGRRVGTGQWENSSS